MITLDLIDNHHLIYIPNIKPSGHPSQLQHAPNQKDDSPWSLQAACANLHPCRIYSEPVTRGIITYTNQEHVLNTVKRDL